MSILNVLERTQVADASHLSEPLLASLNAEHAESEHEGVASQIVGEENDERTQPVDCCNPWRNYNVRLSLALCVVSGIADSIWGTVVLSGFLVALAQEMGRSLEGNTLVGVAEAGQGLTQLIAALPVGYLADTIGKAKVVRFGGGLMLATIALTLAALLVIRRQVDEEDSSISAANKSYMLLVAALALWGVVSGISLGPCQALYADSVPKGKRSEMLTWLYVCYLVSSAVGPLVSIALLLTVSNNQANWSIQEIFPVFFVGVCLEVPAAILMFFFSQKHVVHEDESVETEQSPRTDANPARLEEPCEGGRREGQQGEVIIDIPTTEQSGLSVQKLSKKAIPYVLFGSSLLVSLASGASVKYFPLYFKELGLGSAAVQGIFLAVPLSISVFSFVAQKVSKVVGRVETTVASYILGTSLLFYMTWLSRNVGNASDGTRQLPELCADGSSFWIDNPRQVILIISVYLVRTGIINASYPLLESILMDSVASNQRARWKALESIAAFGWTGSALAGGILSDEHSYQYTFAITATLQLIGGLLLLPIRSLVESEQQGNEPGMSTPIPPNNDAVETQRCRTPFSETVDP
jgi:MFS family permease